MTNKINIEINNQTLTVTLENNNTTQEFLKRLPLNITMSDLNQNEKYYYLKNSLPTKTYQPNIINSGDIMLFGNNCLVIFYKTFPTSYNYTKIGTIDNSDNLEQVVGKKDIKILITKS